MRNTLLILFAGVFQLYAGSSYSQNTKLTLDLRNVTVANVLEEIENNSEFFFLYNAKLIDVNREVTVSAEDTKIADILASLFTGTDVKYMVYDRQIILSPGEIKELTETAQVQKVSGTVKDKAGSPIAGVSVVVKGTNTGTITAGDGSYSIALPSDARILSFSFVGMNTKEITIGNQAVIDVSLEESIMNLDEVLVVGYGTVKKKDVTGSVTSVQPAEFKHQIVNTPAQILKGRAAGVAVTTVSGAPGGDYKIRIRGANSLLGGNDPLLVVDGIQGGISLNDINPNDIASMDILKDASSTAIYGSRGANGVILITTKQGTEGAAKVELNSYISFKNGKNPYAMMEPVLYAETVNLGTPGAYSQDQINALKGTAPNDAYQEMLRQGILQNYEVSVRGGSKLTKYSLSAGIQNEDGAVVNTNLKKYLFRSNISTQITKKLSVDLNLTAVQTKSHNIAGSYEEIQLAPTWGTAETTHNPDGTWKLADPYGAYLANPVMLMNNMNRDGLSTSGQISGNLRYEIIKGLTFQSNAGLNAGYHNGAYFNNEYFQYSGSVGGRTGSGQSSSSSNSWQLSNTLTYTKTINTAHNLSVMAGIEASKFTENGFNADGTVMATTAVGYYNLSMNTNKNISSSYSSSALSSYFARGSYSFRDRYLLTATFRADGSSKFKGDNQYSYFPSVGLGWRLSEEDFIKNMGVFDNLKLRGSWGKTGNQAIGPYGTMSLLTKEDYHYGSGTLYPGYKPYGSSNPNLRWEETTQTDIGLDAGFMKNRLSFTLDMYKKLTSGLLQSVALPAYSGGGTVYQNLGQIENKGIELTINSVIVENADWRLDAGFNISYAKNKVIDVGDETMIFPGNEYGGTPNKWFVVKEGEPLGSFWGYKWLGIWKTSEAAEAAKYGAVPGDNKFEDLNKDGAIGGDDNQVIGHAVSPWRMGFNTTISYKNFTLNALIEGASGGVTYNYQYSMAAILTSEGRTVTLADGADYWTPTNEGARFANILSPTYTAYRNNSQWLYDASYLKFRNLSLSYNLSKEKIKFADLKLFVSAQNILTITRYNGSDPESSSTGGSDVDTGLDMGTYPSVKTYTVGVTLTF